MNINVNTHPLLTIVPQSRLTKQNQDLDAVATSLDNLIITRVVYPAADVQNIPPDFEPQKSVWRSLLTEARDQGSCGSCWSFSTVSCLADRLNILLSRKYIDVLSPLQPTICNDLTSLVANKNLGNLLYPFQLSNETEQRFACKGNFLSSACVYLQIFGTTTNSCVLYKIRNFNDYRDTRLNWGFRPNNDMFFSPQNTATSDFTQYSDVDIKGSCALYNELSAPPFSYCADTINVGRTKWYGTPQQHFRALFVYKVDSHEKAIMAEIFRWGPVVSSFVVYDDFYDFDPKTTPVYVHDPTRTRILGGHSVEIVGWGATSDGTQFWWIKNSWGTQWGDNGYFRFLRGQDQCHIESNVLCMMPNLFLPLGDVDYARELETALSTLGIFQTQMTPEYYSFVEKIVRTYHPGLVQQILDVPWFIRSVVSSFPLLHFSVMSMVGVLTSDILVRTGFTSRVFNTMPGLHLTAPRGQIPLSPTFRAGRVSPKTQDVRMKPGRTSLLFIVSCVLLGIMVVMSFLCFYLR